MNTIIFTHKGWFGLCPVYFAGLDTEAPTVDPRHWALSPLMWLSELVFGLVFFVRSATDPMFEAEWPLNVTGELTPHVERAFRAATEL